MQSRHQACLSQGRPFSRQAGWRSCPVLHSLAASLGPVSLFAPEGKPTEDAFSHPGLSCFLGTAQSSIRLCWRFPSVCSGVTTLSPRELPARPLLAWVGEGSIRPAAHAATDCINSLGLNSSPGRKLRPHFIFK